MFVERPPAAKIGSPDTQCLLVERKTPSVTRTNLCSPYAHWWQKTTTAGMSVALGIGALHPAVVV